MPTTKSTSHPATALAPWPLLSDAEGLHATAGTQTVTCSSTLTGAAQTTCQSYTSLSNYLGIAGGLILTTAEVVYGRLSKSKPKIATDIWSVSGTVYELIRGVTDQLSVAIGDLNAGKPFEPVETPSNLPPFPSPPEQGSEAGDVIQAVWSTLSGVLNIFLSKYKGNDKLRIAIAGLLENGNQAIQKLIPLLKQAFG